MLFYQKINKLIIFELLLVNSSDLLFVCSSLCLFICSSVSLFFCLSVLLFVCSSMLFAYELIYILNESYDSFFPFCYLCPFIFRLFVTQVCFSLLLCYLCLFLFRLFVTYVSLYFTYLLLAHVTILFVSFVRVYFVFWRRTKRLRGSALPSSEFRVPSSEPLGGEGGEHPSSE